MLQQISVARAIPARFWLLLPLMDEGTQSSGPDDQISSEQDQEYQHDLLQLSPTSHATIQHSVDQILNKTLKNISSSLIS